MSDFYHSRSSVPLSMGLIQFDANGWVSTHNGVFGTNIGAGDTRAVEADFNGDGYPDMVSAHLNIFGWLSSEFKVGINDGWNGYKVLSFDPLTYTPLRYALVNLDSLRQGLGWIRSIVPHDFNADGYDDLIVTTNWNQVLLIETVSNTYSAGFRLARNFVPDHGFQGAPLVWTRLVDDMDGDQIPDLVVWASDRDSQSATYEQSKLMTYRGTRTHPYFELIEKSVVPAGAYTLPGILPEVHYDADTRSVFIINRESPSSTQNTVLMYLMD